MCRDEPSYPDAKDWCKLQARSGGVIASSSNSVTAAGSIRLRRQRNFCPVIK